LNAARFLDRYLAAVISQIESLGVGQVGGGWGAEGGLKQPFGLEQQFCVFSSYMT